MSEILTSGLLMLAGVYLAAGLVMILSARTLIYPFAPGLDATRPTGVPGAEAATLAAADGTPLTVWRVRPEPGRPVVIYFTGNAGVLAAHAPMLAEFARRGLGVAALNYRGAAGAPGSPSQEKLVADALTLYEGLDGLMGETVPPERRAIQGASLGAALAVQLAARRAVAAVVLEAPFRRLCEVANHHYPIFPACLILPWERWNSARLIGEIDAPVLVLHGEQDQVIPLAQGKALHAEAEEPKRLIVYPEAGHDDAYAHGAPRDAAAFIEEAAGG